MNALRLGAAQRLFLDTPAHAAVDTTVRLLDGRLSGFKGLANAVVRKVAAAAAPANAARINTPEWLWRSWTKAFGDETAATIAAAHLSEPPLDFTVAGDAETWRDRLAATLLPTGSLRRPIGGDPSALPGFQDGAWWVQDAAAALPARLLGVTAGQRAIDLCAAPGGKTAQLAAAGAEVTAIDRSPQRLARLRANLERLGLRARVVEADAATWRPDEPADAVLLDAPCTATGTIRRHPDIARIKSAADVAKMAAVQDRLLRAAVEMTAPGGRLVYATCSLQPEEGPERIAALLRDGAPVRLDGISALEMPGLSDAIGADGTVRTLPCQWKELGGLDGFFIARLRRV
jgi:16S rRNA (cytosine967-C5)-methyltransferase